MGGRLWRRNRRMAAFAGPICGPWIRSRLPQKSADGTATPCWGRKGPNRREDVLRQLARLAFGRVDDAVTLALRRGETEPEGLELSAVSELRVTEKGVEVKLVDRVRALETLWKLLEASEPQQADPLLQALAALPGETGDWNEK